MQLNFEIINTEVGNGNYPDVVHFANTQAQVFYLDGGELYGQPTDKIDYGEWGDVVFQDELNASPDSGMSHFELKVLPGWGIIGGYKTGNFHKMIIYEFAWEMGQYLNSGSTKHSIDNPVSSFDLSLENPDLKDPEHPGNIAISEERALLSPGAKVIFKFGAGDDEPEFEMGTFYIDRSNFTLMSETASVDGRNLIGKALKDQTLDEHNEYWYNTITNILTEILLNANLIQEQFLIENTSKQYWFSFGPTATPYKAIEDINTLMIDWKIDELEDGTIVIGSPNYAGFRSKGIYVFNRNKDIFSRQVTRDDAEIFNRVCVHTEGFGIVVFRDIESYEGWSLQGNKTMYVQVANNTRLNQIEAYADELASQISNIGKIESFTGPFRPQLTCGDEAVIMNEGGSKSIGLITEVTHNFGKSGFYTNFTVDSGGKLGKGKLSDYIKQISSGSTGAQTVIGYNDIPLDDYRDIAPEGKLSVSSTYNEKIAGPEKMIDGRTGTRWIAADEDEYPFTIWDYGQRCRVDKMVIYLDYEDSEGLFTYPSYKVDYWNGAFWVELFTIPSGTTHLVEEDLDPAVETSRFRISRTSNENRMRIWEWQIHGWG